MAKIAPYRVLGRGYRGGYVATAGRYACGSVKPHRNAAGMTYTTSRGGGASASIDDDAVQLRLYGSLDPLRFGLRRHTERGVCPCCGGKGKLRLNKHGRDLLQARRAVIAERQRRRAAAIEPLLLGAVAAALGVPA